MDVIIVVMDALVTIYEDDLIAMRSDCHTVASRTWSGLSQSADCQLARSRVSSGLHSCQAEDEDEAVQVQDEYFHLVEFHSSSLFFGIFCFLDSSILPSLTFNFAGDLAR